MQATLTISAMKTLVLPSARSKEDETRISLLTFDTLKFPPPWGIPTYKLHNDRYASL